VACAKRMLPAFHRYVYITKILLLFSSTVGLLLSSVRADPRKNVKATYAKRTLQKYEYVVNYCS